MASVMSQSKAIAPGEEDLTALQLYTDLDKGSYFSCGSALLTQIHRNILMTERDNMHSILTDCPSGTSVWAG